MMQNMEISKIALETSLEEKYAHRELIFNTRLSSGCGQSTFGVIDGMRFEFRAGMDYSTLLVGYRDDDVAMAEHEAAYQWWMESHADVHNRYLDGKLNESEAKNEHAMLDEMKPVLALNNGETDSPNVVLMVSSSDPCLTLNHNSKTSTKVSLTEEEIEFIFSERIDTLRIKQY